ncbi:MAG TPA: nucleotidyltransferase domain-containing protein [Thermoanaerobaculia bacterium]|nr:nucleotidyltransferase domain-containing protein [Thermoanaerobaculia bacterium]
MLDREALRSAVAALCQRLGVRRLDLFGSALTADFRPDSDVDVLVEFDRTGGDLFNRYFELKEQLEALVGRPVDLVMADAIKNPYFKAAVEAQREQLYAA